MTNYEIYDPYDALWEAVCKQAVDDLIVSYKKGQNNFECEKFFQDNFPDNYKKIINHCQNLAYMKKKPKTKNKKAA